MKSRLLAVLVAALSLAAPAPAHAGGPSLRIGVAEDLVKQPDLVAARAQMTLVTLAGFDTVRVTMTWARGESQPKGFEAANLENAVAAAQLAGVRLVVAVFPFGSSVTPLTDEARADFAAFAASIARANPEIREFIIGNEPNLNRFWLPQFNPDGSNAAAQAYLELLTRTYDALKAVSPEITVVGGALSPRGSDNPALVRQTHSPTTFILDLGAAYRASGRPLPVMDALAIHPYGDSNRQAPVDSAHPNSTSIGLADYGKLVGLLGQAFDGTPQRGSTLPIHYAEFGIEADIPAERAPLYSGGEPASIVPVDEATQAAYYRQAVELAFCQPTVRGIYLFHTRDEPDRDRWQSGVYYADGTPKPSLLQVRRAADESRRGVVAACPGLALTPRASILVWPRAGTAGRPLVLRLACSLDCDWAATVLRVPGAVPVRTVRGHRLGKVAGRVLVRTDGLRPGRYRLRITLVAPMNPGPPKIRTSPTFVLR